MILTGTEIAANVAAGRICIDPFDPHMTNPNSHNYRLGPVLRTMERTEVLDSVQAPEFEDVLIPPDGIVLRPNLVYLGTTLERIGSEWYVPSLIGRSSVGRLGLYLQISADLGQLGAEHHWTLELAAVQPIRVYAGMTIGQVSFWEPIGEKVRYCGYYGTRSDPAPWSPEAVIGWNRPNHGQLSSVERQESQ
jgi:dCTP deaminase